MGWLMLATVVLSIPDLPKILAGTTALMLLA